MSETIRQFDFSAYILNQILWQYDNAPNIKGLLEKLQARANEAQTTFWTDWFKNVFNVDTADDFGLNVWCLILGLPVIMNQSGEQTLIFGLDNTNRQNFDRGNFSREARGIYLSTEEKRIVVKLRYFQCVMYKGDLFDTNRFLGEVFKKLGQVYYVDNFDMSITYIFGFYPDERLIYAFNYFDLLPHTAGVKIKNIIYKGQSIWGFDNANRKNFDRGAFEGNLI